LRKIKVEVKSSLIDFLEYSQEDFSLIVQYKRRGIFNKKVKRFEEVSPGQFYKMLNSESIGKAYMQLIGVIRSNQC
jgi:hypothetical protein